MAYTFAQLKQLAEHALGSAPDSRISSSFIVNEALRHLWGTYTWSWRVKQATVTIAADATTANLPADFASLHYAEVSSSTTLHLELLQPMEFARKKIAVGASYSGLLACIGVGAQSPSTAAPVWAFTFHPAPAAETTLAIVYDSAPQQFPALDTITTSDTYVVALPDYATSPLPYIIRAKAMSLEVDPQTAEWQAAQAAIDLAVAEDRRRVPPVISSGNALPDGYGSIEGIATMDRKVDWE